MIIKRYIKEKDQSKHQIPKIIVTKEAYTKLFSFSTEQKVEIMLFGTLDRKDSIYTILDFVVPPQTSNSGTFVTTHDEEYSKWLQNMSREERQTLRLHYHTHPNMNTTPSSTDQNTIKDKVENISDYYIRMIGNENQEYHIDFYDVENKLHYEEMDMHLFLDDYTIIFGKHEPQIIPKRYSNAAKELNEKKYTDPVTPYKYTYSFNNYYNYKKPEEKEPDPYTEYYLNIIEKLEDENKTYPSKEIKKELLKENFNEIKLMFGITPEKWTKLKTEEYVEFITEYVDVVVDMGAYI